MWLLFTADNPVPVFPGGWGMIPRWIGTVAGGVDPSPKVLLKWRHWTKQTSQYSVQQSEQTCSSYW